MSRVSVTKAWTLEELHSLPDDGNKYELVHGELFVTHPNPDAGWDAWPVPLLVVEIISPGTRHRDREYKKNFYLESAIAEYWIIDAERRNRIVVRPGQDEHVEEERVEWHPPGREAVLTVSLDEVFGAR